MIQMTKPEQSCLAALCRRQHTTRTGNASPTRLPLQDGQDGRSLSVNVMIIDYDDDNQPWTWRTSLMEQSTHSRSGGRETT